MDTEDNNAQPEIVSRKLIDARRMILPVGATATVLVAIILTAISYGKMAGDMAARIDMNETRIDKAERDVCQIPALNAKMELLQDRLNRVQVKTEDNGTVLSSIRSDIGAVKAMMELHLREHPHLSPMPGDKP